MQLQEAGKNYGIFLISLAMVLLKQKRPMYENMLAFCFTALIKFPLPSIFSELFKWILIIYILELYLLNYWIVLDRIGLDAPEICIENFNRDFQLCTMTWGRIFRNSFSEI